MATTVIVGSKGGKKVIITNNKENKSGAYISKEVKPANAYQRAVMDNAAEIASKVQAAFVAAPIPFTCSVKAEKDKAVAKYKFKREDAAEVAYKDVIKEGNVDIDALTQSLIGLIYRSCMKQMEEKDEPVKAAPAKKTVKTTVANGTDVAKAPVSKTSAKPVVKTVATKKTPVKAPVKAVETSSPAAKAPAAKPHSRPTPKKIFKKEARRTINRMVREFINNKFEENNQQGLYFPDANRLCAKFNGEKFNLDFDVFWGDINDYVNKTGDGYIIEDETERNKKVLADFYSLFGEKKLYSRDAAPEIKELVELRHNILDYHDVLLDGMKNKRIFKRPQRYYISGQTHMQFIETSFGEFSTSTDWAFVDFTPIENKEGEWIQDEKFRQFFRDFKKGIADRGFTLFEYNGGVGLLHPGDTRIAVSTEYNRNVIVTINIAEEGSIMENLDAFFDEVLEKRESKYQYVMERRELQFERRLADTAIYKNSRKGFEKKWSKLYNDESSLLMFMYFDNKHGGNISKEDFYAIAKSCHIDDIIEDIIHDMVLAEVFRCSEERITLAPHAKYMRKYTYWSVKRREKSADEVMEDLIEVTKKQREERDRQKASESAGSDKDGSKVKNA